MTGSGWRGPVNWPSRRWGGRDFVLLGASGSSSITVLELGASGRLQVIDQVLDDLTTRFQGVTVLETATINGQVFVVAGGGDDGLSLFALLPSGRLVHLESISDAAGGTLENVSALALRVSAAGLDVFVTGLGAAGVSQFHLDLGSITAPQIANDQGQKLQGGAGSDLLMGAAARISSMAGRERISCSMVAGQISFTAAQVRMFSCFTPTGYAMSCAISSLGSTGWI